MQALAGRLVSVVVVLAVGALGCGGDGGGGPSDPGPTSVASVRILPVPSDHNLHIGDQYQLEAEVRDARGRRVDRVVTWSFHVSSSSSPPPYASISDDGLLAIETPMRFSLWVRAALEGVAHEESISIEGWTFEEGLAEISGAPYVYTSLRGNSGFEERATLGISCVEGDLDLYVSLSVAPGSGRVRYRIDDGGERIEEWDETPLINAISFPGNPEPLVRELSVADTVRVAIYGSLGEEQNAIFIPRGLDRFLADLIPPCG